MENLKWLPESARKELVEYAVSSLEELKGYEPEASELHQYLFNESPYIIGIHRAKQWLNGFVFEVIAAIRDYEEFNFAEVTTDFSDPEQVVNMFVYIVGEEILSESETLRNNYNKYLSDELIDEIIKEIKQLAN